MKTLFLGGFAARVSPRILAKVTEPLDTTILADERDAQRLIPALAEAEIVVGHIWRKDNPPATRLKYLQSVAAGLDLVDLPSLPPGVTVCNVFGHEPAIAEYVLTAILVLTQRLFETVTSFRAGSWQASQLAGGSPHGEMLGRTIGVVGYGRIGREVAKRAVGFGCRVIAANRSPVARPGDAAEIYPFDRLDEMLPLCDAIVIACGLAPETAGLIDARRIALMKPTAQLVNIARSQIVDEEALYNALSEKRLGGASIDVWTQHWSAERPDERPSPHPFHELPNVLMTPHCSGFSDGTAERRWSAVAGNLDRYVRGERLVNVVTVT